ncbi:hypothetical protein [Zobellella aerophila]|uniref:M14 family metallopeptidase n=1 Tax=Zobellella aerophila TaxID=870480 RepID=A0ABP6WLU8_9GAMM
MSRILLQQQFDRTLEQLVQRYGCEKYRGYRLEAWLFEDEASRRAAESRLAKFGVKARLRSAYKPLVHAFQEEISLEGVASIHIRYPRLPELPQRFLLEAYPLAALVGDARLDWEAFDTPVLCYELIVTEHTGQQHTLKVEAPSRRYRDHIDTPQVSPCGLLRLISPAGDVTEAALLTDYEALFDAAMTCLSEHPWGDQQPCFEELNFSVTLPVADQPLAYGHEAISLHEALHEDLYFSCLEFFQQRAGLPVGDRTLKPGQIVPEIICAAGNPRLEISLRPLNTEEPVRPRVSLDLAPHAPDSRQITEYLDQFPGTRLKAHSRAGRPVIAVHHAGDDAAVIISAAQHANETSGIVGALRAARTLQQRGNSHFVLSPLENPDGYALQGRLVATQPSHMHHAARYTAFGNDLQNQSKGGHYEHAIREQAEAISGAQLHINLHGYPAHEWTRPLTGYVPRGFEMWTIPKGFFLILRHHGSWAVTGRKLLEELTLRLARVPGLVEFNRAQIQLFEIHAGKLEFPMINGFPCLITEDDHQLTPLMLITEYPDETIKGEAFIDAHNAQMETILAAYDIWQSLDKPQ